MNEQARALLLAGVTLFGAGNGSGYMLGRSTAPAVVVVPKTGQAAPATPVAKAAQPSPRVVPVPRPRPTAAIVRERPQAKKKQAQKQTQKRGPTAAQCAQLRNGINKHGLAIVQAGARVRGHSDEDFNWARQRCGA